MFLPRKVESMIRKEDAVGQVVYVLAKLGYSRPQIKKVMDELRLLFEMRCSGSMFEQQRLYGEWARKSMLPTIKKKKN
jgi:hypothetical protein